MSAKPTLVQLILNATAAGKSMLTAANAAAQKTLLSLVKGDVGLGNVDNTADTAKPVSTAQQTALDAKVSTNTAITGATKTKVTYDAKGLVTAGADATTADIADSANRRYVTDAQQTVIVNTSGTNAGDQDLSTYATKSYADALIVGLLDDRGNYNASVNVFPSSGGSGTAGAVLKGDLWTVSVPGTLGGTAVTVGDVVRALVDTPGQTSSNWAIGENNFGYVALNQAMVSGTFYVGNGSGIGTAVTMSGDVTITSAGVSAIGAAKVTNAMLAGSIAASKLVGTDITTVGTVTAGTWSTGAVIGGATVTVGSDATGDVYYRNASGILTRLGIGTAGQVLTVASGLPSWATASGGGSPGGSTTQFQYNNAGVFGGTTAMVYAGTGTHVVVTAQAAATVPLCLQGAASQSGNLTEWKNSGGTVVASISAAGVLSVSSGNGVVSGSGSNTYLGFYFYVGNTTGLVTIEANASITWGTMAISRDSTSSNALRISTGRLIAANGSGTNNAATAMIISPGKSTGTATPATLTLQRTVVGSSGSTAQTLVDAMQLDGNTTAAQTPLLLLDIDKGTLQRVSIGASDSGGTGFKVLRVPN